MSKLPVNNLNGGEWGALLNGRFELPKYYTAARTLLNMVPLPQGAATFCPGFRYIAANYNSAKKSRCYGFVYDDSTAYILEFGDAVLRIFKNQAQVTSGGNPVEIATPYAVADIFDLHFAASPEEPILYIFHKSYAPRKLIRISDTNWGIVQANFNPPPLALPAINPVAALTLGALTGTGVTVTADDNVFLTGDVGKVIVHKAGTGKAYITSVASATSATIDILETFDAGLTGDEIASGNWELFGSSTGAITPDFGDGNNNSVGRSITLNSTGSAEVQTNIGGGGAFWVASGSGTSEYYLLNTHPSFPASKPDSVYEAGDAMYEGTVGGLGIHQWDWGDNDTLGYSTIYVRLIDGSDPDTKAASYNTYGVQSDNYDLFRSNATQGGSDAGKYISINGGLVKLTTITSAIKATARVIRPLDDETQDTDFTVYQEAFNSTDGYPATGTFYEQRMIMAGTPRYQRTAWGSVTGDYENHSLGANDSDAMSFIVPRKKGGSIRWLEGGKSLIAGTADGVVSIKGGTNSPLTPSNITITREVSEGCHSTQPVAADSAILFVERLNTRVRELAYNWEEEGFSAPDMTSLNTTLLGDGIVDWAWQSVPHKILWAVRSDGVLLGLVYDRPNEVVAWFRRATTGVFESVAVIPGADGYDEIWVSVKRTVNGSTVRYIEMLEEFVDEDNATYQGNNGVNAFFVDAGITVTNAPASKTVSGLSHLEGISVRILANGAHHPPKTVSGGAITLDYAADIIQVGFGYDGDIEPLRFIGQNTVGESVEIQRCSAMLYRSLGLQIGPDASNLEPPYTFRSDPMSPSKPPTLFTGIIREIPVKSGDGGSFDSGYVYLRHMTAQPFTIQVIIPEVEATRR